MGFLACFEETDVWQVLDRVGPRYRVPLVLVPMEGIATAQVARMFGVAQNTVLSWLHRGRGHFEHEMWDYAREAGLLEKPPAAGETSQEPT